MPSTIPHIQSARTNLRTSPQAKMLIERAAAIMGATVSGFMLQNAYEAARRIMAEKDTVVDAKHDNARLYYQTMGFTPTLDDPLCLYLPVSVLEKAKPIASRQESGSAWQTNQVNKNASSKVEQWRSSTRNQSACRKSTHSAVAVAVAA